MREPVFGLAELIENLGATVVTLAVVCGWYGAGDVVSRSLARLAQREPGDSAGDENLALGVARTCAFGAGLSSIVWFGLGLGGLYQPAVGVLALALGLGLFVPAARRLAPRVAAARQARAEPRAERVLATVLLGAPLLAAWLAALAPPTGKDALIYHRAVPKAFAAGGGLVDVPRNIASFFAFGGEMNGLWAMLVGDLFNRRVGEAAFGAALFAFFPLLLLAVYGWVRERGVPAPWAVAAPALVAAIPTVHVIAANAYIDLALALYATLAIEAAASWWTGGGRLALARFALALGFAVAVKHVGVLMLVPVPLLILLRARLVARRDAGAASRVVVEGLTALAVAGLLGSVWYVRNWVRTGSPLFPFYVSVWKASAVGWDERRSTLLSRLLAYYGGPDKGVLDYLGAPVWLSLVAQPEDPVYYEGVLGIWLLFGLPFLVWALWRGTLDPAVRLAAAAGATLFTFWAASSQSLRYLLPALPSLTVAVVAAMASVATDSRQASTLRGTLLATTLAGHLVTAAWFLDGDPVRAAFGGESRASYLGRRLDYYGYYRLMNAELPPEARVWLINMRRDTYHLDRRHFADYLFEDWTIRTWVEEARSAQEVRRRAQAAGITHVLVRHDLLFDPARSPIVDDHRAPPINEEKMQILRVFFLEGTRVLRADAKYLLVELPLGG